MTKKPTFPANINLINRSLRSTTLSNSATSFNKGRKFRDNLFTVQSPTESQNLGVFMCPSHSSLLPPRVTIGIDDAVPKNVEYFMKLIALWIVGEVKAEHVVGTVRAASKQDVHPAKPWASEHEGVIKLPEHGSHVVEEAMAVGDHRREHTDHRPVIKDLAAALSRAVKVEGNKESGKYC